jgi:hypothetical protein
MILLLNIVSIMKYSTERIKYIIKKLINNS